MYLKQWLEKILYSASEGTQRPLIKKNYESNVPGLYIIGDLAGAPVIKYAMEQGYNVIEHIKSLSDYKSNNSDIYDILVVGSGAAGLNAALSAQDKGLRCVVLEKNKIANTIENFPEGKWVYAEPEDIPPRGKLWLDGASREDLIQRWHQIIKDNNLDVRINEPLISLEKKKDHFIIHSNKGQYLAKRVILATGQRGNPRRLGVAGEDSMHIYHSLYNASKFHDRNILIIGGGNTAVESAISLCERNHVILTYRGSQFSRIFKDNKKLLDEKLSQGKISLYLETEVLEFKENNAILTSKTKSDTINISYDLAYILIGNEIPRDFLKSLGIQMETEWYGKPLNAVLLVILSLFGLWVYGSNGDILGYPIKQIPSEIGIGLSTISISLLVLFGIKKDRYAWLGIMFLICYTIYGVKTGHGSEFWPFKNWGYHWLSFFERPWSFWYTVLYTLIMTIFGFQAMKRWGFDKKDWFQIWRYISLLAFQWMFFFIIPEFLFQWAVKYQWIGTALSSDPNFTEQAWRTYGIIYAWPLFFYTFFYNPHTIWIVWGLFLSFIIIPLLTIWHGKRYCSWICGCGGLAETLGDRWRHLAPKGKSAVKLEWMNMIIFIFAVTVTVIMLLKDIIGLFDVSEVSISIYRVLVDIWLVGILPVTLYPFLGGKIWCRYWCPLAKFMHITSKLFTKIGVGKFAIKSNHKCIGCNECSRNCQVGIDVMNFALNQETLDNTNSSCIGCGICISACPMDVLSFRYDVKLEQKDNLAYSQKKM